MQGASKCGPGALPLLGSRGAVSAWRSQVTALLFGGATGYMVWTASDSTAGAIPTLVLLSKG